MIDDSLYKRNQSFIEQIMDNWLTYGIIVVILFIAELVYFKIADKGGPF